MSDRVDSRAQLASPPEGTTAARIWDVLAALGRRWPTWLALALVALGLGGGGSDDEVRGLSVTLLLLPFGYLLLAAVRRRRASWIVAIVGTAAMFVLSAAVAVPVFITAALIILVWGAVQGRLHSPDTFRVQALGMVGFGAIALAGLAVDADLGRYLVAAGWFLHGIWDLVYFRADKVVARSFAEWCGVVDVLIAAQLIFRS